MNVRKSLTAAVGAATVVGAIGLAYAQNSTDAAAPAADMNARPAQPAQDTPAMPAAPTATPDAATMNNNTAPANQAPPDSTINNAASDAPPASTEPAPKPDRN